MTRNGDELVHLYNEIDAWLKVRSGIDGDDGFVARLNTVRGREAVIRPYVDFLKDVARLRNAIVHDREYPEIVADPRDELIARLRLVRDAILKPPHLRSFGSKPVALSADRALREALALMRQKDFSQIVIELAKEFTLLSSEGILRWLEICAENLDGLADIDRSLLRQVVEHEPEGVARGSRRTGLSRRPSLASRRSDQPVRRGWHAFW